MKAVLSYQYIESNVCEKLDPYICQEREREKEVSAYVNIIKIRSTNLTSSQNMRYHF